MALTVGTNTGALMAQAAASATNKSLEISMERLSTGKRINSAADDAAGVAIASRLTSEIRGTNQAIRNAMDGQALIDTAEGAHSEVENILQRMREVAAQSANDTNSAADRASLKLEMDQLTSEIDRVAGTTTWAGQTLMAGAKTNGEVSAVAGATKNFNFQISGNDFSATNNDRLTVGIKAIDAASLSLSGTQTSDIDNLSITKSSDGSAATGTFAKTTVSNNIVLTVGGTVTTGETIAFEFDGNAISVVTDSVAAGASNDVITLSKDGTAHKIITAINALNVTGISATRTAEGVVTIVKAGSVDISSNSLAETAMGTIDAAIKTLNDQRAQLGSYSNRLDSTVSNLTNISANLQAGRGRIEDADFAAETTNLAKSQILQQASTAMLAQANASKQGVLSLLQG